MVPVHSILRACLVCGQGKPESSFYKPIQPRCIDCTQTAMVRWSEAFLTRKHRVARVQSGGEMVARGY